ncbi:Golgin candidate 6 [Camellia lanceoleosa]|uniref:Golgin candidate 6 n=1 Tax=Camellia lanceoleosa TaxID=1840588 RepID=A0ACC0G3I8_9ERIC|nr:Golgin candidate 6 [Camellia lanceoleosa]
MQKSIIFSSAKPTEPRKPLTRSTAASMAEIEDVEENKASDLKNEDHPMLASMFDAQFVDFIKNLEADIRESIIDVYSHPKSNVAVVLAELQQKGWESDGDYVKRLKSFVEKQCSQIMDLLSRNATLAEDLAKIGRGGSSQPEHRSSGGSERVQLETLHRDLQEASQQLDTLKTEKTKIESEASMYCNLAGKMEFDLKSLSDAYNSLEQANLDLEKEIKALKSGGATPILVVEAVQVELKDLLVCLGQ